MEDFAKYAFNKSHGAAYAVIAAQTAWLMYYYPVIFMKANINVYIGNKDKLKMYLAYCSRVGINILPPSVNESEEFFSLNKDATAIRFGLKGVKNLDKVSKSIINEREERGLFTSIENFIKRMIKYQKLSRSNVEALIYVGAFDEFTGTRREKIESLDKIFAIQKSISTPNQASIFDIAEEFNIVDMDELLHVSLSNSIEFDKDIKLEKENEYSGFYITGHPLDDYKMILDCSDLVHISDLVNDEDINNLGKKEVKVGGLIKNLERKLTKKGDYLYTFTLSDMTGDISMVCFKDAFNKNESRLVENAKVTITGNFDVNDFGPQIVVNTVLNIDDIEEKIYAINLYSDEDIVIARQQYIKLKTLHPTKTGNINLNFMRNNQVQPGIDKCDLSLEFFSILQNIFGEQSCKVVYKKK